MWHWQSAEQFSIGCGWQQLTDLCQWSFSNSEFSRSAFDRLHSSNPQSTQHLGTENMECRSSMNRRCLRACSLIKQHASMRISNSLKHSFHYRSSNLQMKMLEASFHESDTLLSYESKNPILCSSNFVSVFSSSSSLEANVFCQDKSPFCFLLMHHSCALCYFDGILNSSHMNIMILISDESRLTWTHEELKFCCQIKISA